jgi:hypothetical protein
MKSEVRADYIGQQAMGLNGEKRYRDMIKLIHWSRVLLEKLTGFQLVRKLTAFYGT